MEASYLDLFYSFHFFSIIFISWYYHGYIFLLQTYFQKQQWNIFSQNETHYLHLFVESWKSAQHVTRVCKTSLHDWSIRVVIVRKTTRGRTAFVVNLKPMRSFEKYSPYLACPSLCSLVQGNAIEGKLKPPALLKNSERHHFSASTCEKGSKVKPVQGHNGWTFFL